MEYLLGALYIIQDDFRVLFVVQLWYNIRTLRQRDKRNVLRLCVVVEVKNLCLIAEFVLINKIIAEIQVTSSSLRKRV